MTLTAPAATIETEHNELLLWQSLYCHAKGRVFLVYKACDYVLGLCDINRWGRKL